jgi:hypothetical protein
MMQGPISSDPCVVQLDGLTVEPHRAVRLLKMYILTLGFWEISHGALTWRYRDVRTTILKLWASENGYMER